MALLTRICRNSFQIPFQNVANKGVFIAQVHTFDGSDYIFPLDRKIPIAKAEQIKLKNSTPVQPTSPRVLKVAIIGAPSAGKSTLANQLIGWKFSSASSKVHTTRAKILGVLTEGSCQVEFLDTPGMLSHQEKAKRHRLEESLLKDPYISLKDADLIAVVHDVSTQWGAARLDSQILNVLHIHQFTPAILVLNKVDKVRNKENLLKVTRILTKGIVGGVKSSFTDNELRKQKKSVDELAEEVLQQKLNRQDEPPTAPSRKSRRSHLQWEKTNMSSDNGEVSSVTQITGDTVFSDSERLSSNVRESSCGPNNLTQNMHSDTHINTGSTDISENSDVAALSADSAPDPANWTDYQRRLKVARELTGNTSGWPKFSQVFMVSALDGDGVSHIKEHMLRAAKPGSWRHHGDLVTDQDPQEMARAVLRQALLDHVKEPHVAYKAKVELLRWMVASTGELRAQFEVICDAKWELGSVVGVKGATVEAIRQDLYDWLSDTFRCKVVVSVHVMVKGDARLLPSHK